MNAELLRLGLLFVGADGTVDWRSGRVAAIAAVRVEVGHGIVVDLDPAFPGEILAWQLSATADIPALVVPVGDPGLAAVVAEARIAGPGERVVPGPQPAAAWARFAEVASVRRWTMRPVHHAGLLIDRAVAAAEVGLMAEAATLFIYAEDALPDLIRRCVEGELPSAVVDLVRAAIRAAQRAGARGTWAASAAELEDVAVLDDSMIRSTLAEWRRHAAAVTGLAGTLGETGEPTEDSDFLDPLAVPSRIIAWGGANRPELRIRHERDDGVLVLDAPVAAGVDPYCREVGRLLAYAADRADGTLVAVAPMRLDGSVLIARLPANDRTPEELTFGVLDADTDVAALRTDSVGRCLMAVDRMMIEAWAHQRAATATAYAVSPDAAESDLRTVAAERRSRQRAARTLVAAARKRLEREARSLTADDGTAEVLTTLLRARQEAIGRYADTIETGSGTPLLTDLIPPEPGG
ncbi:hypothetical protein [Nocardia sp. BMG111209]|uniref:hypothetical protein n=1 Tax=Nocardia sp. BMG111209 TaxID=1160137 RepID=UPI0003811986|nr:hypothetical protein [Nocardia sp. BMG111209]